MSLYKAIFGLIGASITLYSIYNCYIILKHLKENEDVAISMFLLNNDAPERFRRLAYISIFYAGIALLVVSGVVPDSYPYDIAVITLFLGLAYFLRSIKDITAGVSE